MFVKVYFVCFYCYDVAWFQWEKIGKYIVNSKVHFDIILPTMDEKTSLIDPIDI